MAGVMRTRLIAIIISLGAAWAQPPGANYDEAKVPRYTLPDLLTLANGQKVGDARTWNEARRPEIYRLLESQMFGRGASRPQKISYELTSIDKAALGGKAIRKEVTINTAGKALRLLLYLPAGARGPVPVFVGLNFNGNHAATAEPGVRIVEMYGRDPSKPPQMPPESSRGNEAGRW
jgi:hypothetical protein